MLNKKSYAFFFVSLLIIAGMIGCGGGDSANLDVSTSSSGAQLQSISITPANPTLAVDTSKQFTATGVYSDNTTRDLTASVVWTSSASDGAPGIDEARFTGLYSSGSNYRPGHLTATRPGKAKINGKWGNVSGSTDVTVTPATLVSIAVTPTSPSIAPGTSQQFTATGTFTDNTTQDLTTDVTWNSSAAAVAAISNAAGSNGLATSAAAGSTTITATSGSIMGSATLIVTGGGVATLTWDAPTTNTDGSPLNPATDLSTYKIYYGTASQTYAQAVTVTNPGTATVTKTLNLSPGTYYFVVTTVNTSGQESSYSNEAIKAI